MRYAERRIYEKRDAEGGFMKRHMQKGGIQKSRDGGKEGYSKGGSRKGESCKGKSWKAGCRKGGIWEMMDANELRRKKGCKKGGKEKRMEIRDALKNG